MTAETTHPKWYQEPIVWLIWGLLITVVVACMITVVLAVKSDDGLVIDNYYREGLAINRSLNANDTAITLGVNGRVDVEPQLITVDIHSAQGLLTSSELSLRWVHPTNRRLDANIALLFNNASGLPDGYRWQLNPQTMGLHEQWQSHRWHIVLSSNAAPSAEQGSWRIQGELPVCCERAAILQAQ